MAKGTASLSWKLLCEQNYKLSSPWFFFFVLVGIKSSKKWQHHAYLLQLQMCRLSVCIHNWKKSISYEFSPMPNLCLKITQIKCKTRNHGSLEAYYWIQTFTVSHCKGKEENENQTNDRVTWENTGHCNSGLEFWKVIYGMHRNVWVCNNVNVSRQRNKIAGINSNVIS